jgi:conjugative transfer signal peptidase TraF
VLQIADGTGRQSPQIRAALGIAGIGLMLLLLTAFLGPRLVWNASASAPIGLYLRVDAVPQTGDFALIRTPDTVRELAARRGYLPANVPMVKQIAARSGDTICAIGEVIYINGDRVAKRLATDSQRRPLPSWTSCHRLAGDQFFPLMRNVQASFDGRYFGPVARKSILGKLIPLWTR